MKLHSLRLPVLSFASQVLLLLFGLEVMSYSATPWAVLMYYHLSAGSVQDLQHILMILSDAHLSANCINATFKSPLQQQNILHIILSFVPTIIAIWFIPLHAVISLSD